MADEKKAPVTVDAGNAAPTFSLKDQDGKTHSLADFKGKWVVIYFYPKDDTPGCTTEACQFRDEFGVLKKKNVVVLGVSPDDEKSHGKFAKKFTLPFPLLADTEKAMCEAYGVWGEKLNYGKKYMGVIRTTYLIDAKGKVAFRWDKVKAGGHAAAVIAKVVELGG